MKLTKTEIKQKRAELVKVLLGIEALKKEKMSLENTLDNDFTKNEAAKPENERLKEREGFTPAQRFFLAYANVWAGNIRPEEILQRTKSDPHSLGRWRVNGALPQINAWYEAWNVTEESPLFIPEDQRVKIW